MEKKKTFVPTLHIFLYPRSITPNAAESLRNSHNPKKASIEKPLNVRGHPPNVVSPYKPRPTMKYPKKEPHPQAQNQTNRRRANFDLSPLQHFFFPFSDVLSLSLTFFLVFRPVILHWLKIFGRQWAEDFGLGGRV